MSLMVDCYKCVSITVLEAALVASWWLCRGKPLCVDLGESQEEENDGKRKKKKKSPGSLSGSGGG